MTTTPVSPASMLLGDLGLCAVDEDGVEWWATLTGWGSPGSTIDVQQNEQAHGGWAGDAYSTPRHLGIEGTIIAPTHELLVRAADRLRAAVTFGGSKLAVTEGELTRWCIVRREDEVDIPMQTSTWSSFSAQVVALDPRLYGDPIVLTTGVPSTSGGLTWPVSWPVRWTGSTNTGTLHWDNPGNAEAPVYVRVDGPCIGPRMTHTGLGADLVLSSSYTVGAGSWLDIDMANQRVLEAGQALRNGFVLDRGWFLGSPGANDVICDAAVRDPATLFTLTTWPAWL